VLYLISVLEVTDETNSDSEGSLVDWLATGPTVDSTDLFFPPKVVSPFKPLKTEKKRRGEGREEERRGQKRRGEEK
jgi:hypothetical protein